MLLLIITFAKSTVLWIMESTGHVLNTKEGEVASKSGSFIKNAHPPPTCLLASCFNIIDKCCLGRLKERGVEQSESESGFFSE